MWFSSGMTAKIAISTPEESYYKFWGGFQTQTSKRKYEAINYNFHRGGGGIYGMGGEEGFQNKVNDFQLLQERVTKVHIGNLIK